MFTRSVTADVEWVHPHDDMIEADAGHHHNVPALVHDRLMQNTGCWNWPSWFKTCDVVVAHARHTCCACTPHGKGVCVQGCKLVSGAVVRTLVTMLLLCMYSSCVHHLPAGWRSGVHEEVHHLFLYYRQRGPLVRSALLSPASARS
jgi:hypothetical protein